MAFGSRRRQPRRYVEPPELRAGMVVFFDRQAWYVSAMNAGNGRVPRSLAGLEALTGQRLADEFRAGWLRARDGAATVSEVGAWLAALPGQEAADPAGWGRFFAAGGAVFRVTVLPRSGITAMRCGWGWSLTGNQPVWPSDKPADNLVVFPAPRWREAVADEAGWRHAEQWALAAGWMRDRARADSRVAAWWVAGEDAAPRLPLMTRFDAETAVRTWWSGDWLAKGVPVTERYRLPEPDAGPSFWYALLRWDPRAARPDGLADVLGLRRAAKGVDIFWWSASPAGFGPPLRATGPDGTPLDIDTAERVVAAALVQERPPADVRWVEVSGR